MRALLTVVAVSLCFASVNVEAKTRPAHVKKVKARKGSKAKVRKAPKRPAVVHSAI